MMVEALRLPFLSLNLLISDARSVQ
jgi:hypothetical protein